MPAVIYTNQASLMAQKGLLGAQNSLALSVERLSSGLRINRAKDDAAGLGVGENLQKQLNGVKQGINNLNDAISMAQTAEGALQAVSAMAQRIIMLATQGANETMSNDQRGSVAKELMALRDSINSVAGRTKYTGTMIFGQTGSTSIQVSNEASDTIAITTASFGNMAIAATGGTSIATGVTVSGTANGAALFTAITAVNPTATPATPQAYTTLFTNVQSAAATYLTEITTQRGSLGAVQNQLEYTVSNLTEFANNLSASRSRVMDTDYAAETANLTKGQILQQAATAMLAQANQMPNVILTLLK
jgi:flagellin